MHTRGHRQTLWMQQFARLVGAGAISLAATPEGVGAVAATGRGAMKRWVQNDLYDIPGFRFHISVGSLVGDAWEERNPEFGRLVLIRRGSAQHVCSQGTFPVRTGDIFYVFPGSAHGYRQISKLECVDILFDHSMFLHPHPELLRLPGYRTIFQDGPKQRNAHPLPGRLRLEGPPLNRALELAANIHTEYTVRYPGCEAAIRSFLILLVTHIARQFAEQRLACASAVTGLNRAANYLETNYQEQICLDDVVREACMSRSSFMRAFRGLYNTTPLKYLNEIRLQKAAYRLKFDTASITEIALDVGFSDSNYFSRLFNKHYGVSPRAFRSRFRG